MTGKKTSKTTPTVDRREGDGRRSEGDRRETADRRAKKNPIAVERRKGAERRTQGPEAERRKVQRRINEYVLEPDILEFINAVNEFKSVEQKPFPTWSEIHKIFVSLGYRKAD